MRTLVVAPHPDDEVLGCGGTMLRRKQEGVELGWLIVTSVSEKIGWTQEDVESRDSEINEVANMLGIDEVFNLRLPAAQLDVIPLNQLIERFSSVFNRFQPEEVFVPHGSDVHTDHRVVCDVVAACAKWFRYPFVKRVLAYETLSETGFGLNFEDNFRPNYYVDISAHIERKLEVMAIYKSELGVFPFPRSLKAIRALAALRGSSSGYLAAEAFQLLLERR